MSATRFDTSSWLSGATLLGGGGFGVRGDAIPSTGDTGPAYAYNDLSLPADAAKEICGRITVWPSNGTLIANEDTSFSFTAPDGSYSFQYQLYQDGAAVGSPTTANMVIGSVPLGGSISAATTLTGNLKTLSGVGGAIVGNTTITASLTTTIKLSGAIAVNTVMTGGTQVASNVAGGIVVATTLAGSLASGATLSGSIVARFTTSASFTAGLVPFVYGNGWVIRAPSRITVDHLGPN